MGENRKCMHKRGRGVTPVNRGHDLRKGIAGILTGRPKFEESKFGFETGLNWFGCMDGRKLISKPVLLAMAGSL